MPVGTQISRAASTSVASHSPYRQLQILPLFCKGWTVDQMVWCDKPIGKLGHLGKLIVCLYAIPEMHTFSHVTIFEAHVIACYEVLRAVEWNQGFTKHTVRSGAVVKYGWSVCVQMYVYVCIYAGMNICVRMVRVWIYVSSVYTLRGDPFWQSPDFHDLACHNLHQVFVCFLTFKHCVAL